MLFSIVNICLAVNKTVTVESMGISIINSNNAFSREKAINDAFQKALKKVIVEFNIEVDEEYLNSILTNPEKYITGYELIEEKQEGNILNEKLKVYIDIQKIFGSLKVTEKKTFNPVYILSYCYKRFNNASRSFDKSCNNIIQNNLKPLNNIFFLKPSETFDELFKTEKDILIIAVYDITNSRRIYSINKEFDNISFEITVYNSENDVVKSFDIAKKVVSSIGDNPLLQIKNEIFNPVTKFVNNLKEKILKEKAIVTSTNKFYFIAKKIANYDDIKNLEKFFIKYNIDYTLISIENKRFIYGIRNISENELTKLIKFSDLDYNYLEIGDNVTMSFD